MIINETRTDNDSEWHLHSRLFMHALSNFCVDGEASKSDSVRRYVISLRTTNCTGPQGAPQGAAASAWVHYLLKSFR